MIRPATPADEPAVLTLTHELADFAVPPWRTADEIRQADLPILRAALATTPPDQLLLVAQDHGRMQGFVYAVTNRDYFTGELHAYVEDLAIAPDARGKGVARQLMGAVEEWARAQGYRRIRLAVWAQNERARGLYEHIGYRPETMYYIKHL
jgi:ribosomal protein S18 acetylase RimI-like enzyme